MCYSRHWRHCRPPATSKEQFAINRLPLTSSAMTLPSVITGGGTDLVTAIQSYTNNQSPNSAPKSKDRLAAGTLSHYANGSSGFIRGTQDFGFQSRSFMESFHTSDESQQRLLEISLASGTHRQAEPYSAAVLLLIIS